MFKSGTYLLTFVSLFALAETYALVDYSAGTSSTQNKSNRAKRSSRSIKKLAAPKKTSSRRSTGLFDFTTAFESLSIQDSGSEAKINRVFLDGHIQTSYNLFIDFSYFVTSTKNKEFSPSTSYEEGNPLIILGFNWLRFGKAEEMSTLDLYGGARFSAGGALATSRTDKIIGLETSKRFYTLALALAYELHITGNPEAVDELGIGNISWMKASGGWVVSPDIQFVIEGGTVAIGRSKSEERISALRDEQKYSYVRPTLSLGITPSLNVELGAVFRTRRALDTASLVDAKLIYLPGALGNSLFAGLNFSL